jgi:hypothetical protein
VVTGCDVVKIYVSDGGEAGQLGIGIGLPGMSGVVCRSFRPADVDERKTRGSAVEECRLARGGAHAASERQVASEWVCDEAMRTFPSRTLHCPAIAALEPPHCPARQLSRARHQESCNAR